MNMRRIVIASIEADNYSKKLTNFRHNNFKFLILDDVKVIRIIEKGNFFEFFLEKLGDWLQDFYRVPPQKNAISHQWV